MDNKHIIAKRIAKEFNNGDVVNLGIGVPNFIPLYTKDKEIYFQGDNGVLGLCGFQEDEVSEPYHQNAGGQFVKIEPYGCFFDACMSFDMIGGGHIDYTVLGALQVDSEGNIANWIIPGKFIPGMGGAMDLCTGCKKVFVAMEHTAKGKPKLVDKCTMPLTATKCVDMIFTEMCVIKVTNEGLLVTEIREGLTPKDVQNATDATLIFDKNFTTF